MLVKGSEPQVPKSPCLHPDHVFLDSCTTFIQMTGKNLLSDVRKSETYLYRFCDADTFIINLKGKLGHSIFGKDTDTLLHTGIADIIIIPAMKRLDFHILYNSNDNCWVVSNGGVIVTFHKDDQGLS